MVVDRGGFFLMFVELWKPAPCGSRGLFATLLCIMTIASIGLLAWCLRDVLQQIFEQQGPRVGPEEYYLRFSHRTCSTNSKKL